MNKSVSRRSFLAATGAALSAAALPVSGATFNVTPGGGAPGTLVLRRVRPMGGPEADVLIQDGRIARMGPKLAVPPGTAEEDGGGGILIPGLVDAHAHLDKNLLGMPWYNNLGYRDLNDIVEKERGLKKKLNMDPARQSARQVIKVSGTGTTHIRSHVDIDTDIGLWGIDGVLETKAAYADLVDIELVAFPQSGLLKRPGTLELMDAALKRGVEVVGGIDPCSMDRDPIGSLNALFGLCERYGRPLDIHIHERGELGAFSMGILFDRTRALGMKGKVTVSHAFCLGSPNVPIDKMIETLAELDIAIMTNGPSGERPPVSKLRKAGVRVCAGSDGIRDTWKPFGNADMLERATVVAQANGYRSEEDLATALDVLTHGGAGVMGIKDYGIAVGNVADLVVVPGQCVAELVAADPIRHIVFKRGRVVARDGVCVRKPV